MATRKAKAQTARQAKASSASTSITNGNGTTVKAAVNGAHSAPTVEQVRQRAYQLYVERGARHGQDLDDWFLAEKQLLEPIISS
jgi:hypothetical protein